MLQALNLNTHNQSDATALDAVITRLRLLQDQIGCDKNFAHWKVTTNDMDTIVQAVASDPAGVAYPIPPEITARIIEKVAI